MIVEKKNTVSKTRDVELTQKMLNREKKALKDKVQELQRELAEAKTDVLRAKKEVDNIRAEPVVEEPSVLDEQKKAAILYPTERLPAKRRCMFSSEAAYH